MSFLIQASKYTKIFCIRDWMPKCLADPSLIQAETPFEVTIPRSAGAIKLKHRVPAHAQTLLPRLTTIHNKRGEITDKKLTRVPGDDETRNLVAWITGGPDGQQYMENDRWGVVELPSMTEFMTLQAEFFNQEAMLALYPDQTATIEADRKKIMDKMRAGMRTAIADAVGRADQRVLRAIKSVYRNFFEQNRTNLENGVGRISPTDAEKLVAYFLHDHIQKKNEKEKDMMTKVHAVMNQTAAGGGR